MSKALPGEINGDPVDRFTIVHFGAGAAYGLLGLPLWTAAVVGVAWEVLENPLKDRFPGAFPHASHDTLANAAVDTAAFVGGAYLTGRKKR